MAVMGVQVVVSLLAASVMQKLAPHCSFARWMLCNGSLYRYKHPSEEELRVLAGKQRPKTKRDRRMNGVTDDKPLSVPRDIDLHLDTSPITAVDALVLRYFLEYQWFVDFAVYATAVYVFTEGYSCVVEPQREMNLGVLWCLLTVFFSIKVFFMVMRHYFRSEEGGERSVCLTFAFFFLLLAMVALVIREHYLEFGLEPGLDSVSSNLESVLKPRGWDWTLPLAKLAFKLGLVALCSFLGACLTFPGLRLAQTHLDALRMTADRPLTQLGDIAEQGWGVEAGTPSSVGSAPREFPGTGAGGGAVDQAHLTGIPAARAHGQTDGADPVGLSLQHSAALGRGGAVWVAPGSHPPPPAGVPGPGRALGAADEEGSRTHRRRGDPAQDHEDLLLRAGGQPAVPGAHHPHPALHAAPKDIGAPLVGAVPGALSHPHVCDRGTITSRRGGRGGRACGGGADHGCAGRHPHPALLPWTLRLPHLVGGCVPGRHQPLRPLLPPVPGRVLTGGAGTCARVPCPWGVCLRELTPASFGFPASHVPVGHGDAPAASSWQDGFYALGCGSVLPLPFCCPSPLCLSPSLWSHTMTLEPGSHSRVCFCRLQTTAQSSAASRDCRSAVGLGQQPRFAVQTLGFALRSLPPLAVCVCFCRVSAPCSGVRALGVVPLLGVKSLGQAALAVGCFRNK